MRALVVGFGSIGRRHARILHEMGMPVAVVTRSSDTGAARRYSELRTGLADWEPDYVVVANATVDHYDTLVAISKTGFVGKLLVEKPIFENDVELPAGLPAVKVGYNLRCHPLLGSLRLAISNERVVSAVIHAGQYLPAWRPESDYRQTYSAHRERGGGVMRDLSHELDLALWLFGRWRAALATFGHWSDLEIDSEDVCSALLRTELCPSVAVSLDYLDRQGRRFIVVQTDRHTYMVDLISGTYHVDEGETKLRVDRDQTYREQHRRMVEQDGAGLCSGEEARDVLTLIEAMESSQEQRRWIECVGNP